MADEHGRFAWVYRSEGHRCRKPPRLDQERAVIARRKIEGFIPLCRLQGGGKLGGAGDCDRGCDARCGYTYRRDHRKVQQLHRRWSLEREKTDANLLRSEEHTSELQPLMRISYAVFRFKKKTN